MTNANEGMVKTPQILWDFRQSEVRDELNDEKTTENPDEIEENWVELKRRTRTRMFRGKEEGGKSRRKVQIFVKVDGGRTTTMEMALSDKVNDIVKRIPTSAWCNKCDENVTCQGKVLKRNEELRSCGVSDDALCRLLIGCTAEENTEARRTKLRRKQPRVKKGQEPERGQQEHDEEKIFQSLLNRESAEFGTLRKPKGLGRLSRTWRKEVIATWNSGYKSIRR